MKLVVEGRGEVLCDDRNIVRRSPGGFRVYGTWSHGEVPIVSSASAPLPRHPVPGQQKPTSSCR